MKTTKKTSYKQKLANKKNAQGAGVKTNEGKEISKLNAIKHGCLTCIPLQNELINFQKIKEQLELDLKPISLIEHLYIERIALHVLQLRRVSFAISEFYKCLNDPKVIEPAFDISSLNDIVVNEGYKPEIVPSDIETLLRVYSRYENAIENRLYKAVKEFKNLQ